MKTLNQGLNMKIALIGYGKMGKLVEQIALQLGHEIVVKITSTFQEWHSLKKYMSIL